MSEEEQGDCCGWIREGKGIWQVWKNIREVGVTLQIHGNDFGSYSTLLRKLLERFEYRSDKIRIRFQTITMIVLLRTDLLGNLGVGRRTTGNDGGIDQNGRVGGGLT